MKLAKEDRKKLYEAQKKGKPLELTWPVDAPILERGCKYPVYSEKGERVFTVRVEDFRPHRHGKRATVVIDGHSTGVLPGLLGVRREDGSYETEPEPVDAAWVGRRSMEGQATTTMLGAAHRDLRRALGSKKQGKQAQERIARAQRRLEEVA